MTTYYPPTPDTIFAYSADPIVAQYLKLWQDGILDFETMLKQTILKLEARNRKIYYAYRNAIDSGGEPTSDRTSDFTLTPQEKNLQHDAPASQRKILNVIIKGKDLTIAQAIATNRIPTVSSSMMPLLDADKYHLRYGQRSILRRQEKLIETIQVILILYLEIFMEMRKQIECFE